MKEVDQRTGEDLNPKEADLRPDAIGVAPRNPDPYMNPEKAEIDVPTTTYINILCLNNNLVFSVLERKIGYVCLHRKDGSITK